MNTNELPTVPAIEDMKTPFRYFPLPHTDVGAFKDRRILAALKRHEYQFDPRGSGLVLNEESGESMLMFGVSEETAARTDAHWDILRAMDARSKKAHRVRIFPYVAADAHEQGRVVVLGHPAYESWYDLGTALYDDVAVHVARFSLDFYSVVLGIFILSTAVGFTRFFLGGN